MGEKLSFISSILSEVGEGVSELSRTVTFDKEKEKANLEYVQARKKCRIATLIIALICIGVLVFKFLH